MAMSNPVPRICAGLLLVLPMLCAGQETAPPPSAEASPPAEAAPAVPATVPVVMHTTLGDIHLALEVERAPITAGNFLRYVDAKRFDGITFYRAMKVSEDGKYGLVQGGLSDPKLLYKPIAHESPATTGLSHVDGAISMGRNEPGSAVADFFIVIGDLVSMDGTPDGKDPGYAVFGHVTEGMDVVHAILDLPRSEAARNPVMEGQMLAEPVKVLTVRREPQQ
jgi:peptidyl-prolyl cis-trans isomerase A (cyclophilin A)